MLDLTPLLDFLASVTGHKYFGILLAALEQIFPYIAPIIGGLFGARWGVSAFKKSKEYQFTQERMYEFWRERQRIGLPDNSKDRLKSYFNTLVQTIYGPPKEGYDDAINAYPADIISKVNKSALLQRRWEKHIDAMRSIGDEYRNKRDPNAHI